MSVPSGSDAPVFIIGIMHRSGTNFLCDVLRLHSSFRMPLRVVEDNALKYAPLLVDYADKTYASWGSGKVPLDEGCKDDLLADFGGGMVRFLRRGLDEGARLLTKTPGTANLVTFFRLFPEAKLLILTRDGRDVVESASRSWGSRPQAYWMMKWAANARQIRQFVEGPGRGHEHTRWRLIRYEDLVTDTATVVRDVLAFVGADPAQFDWDALERLPLRGSSVHRGEKSEVHWGLVEKPRDFQPIGRWSSWSASRRWLFKRLAGRELIDLGYVGSDQW
jgi:hypothetical protein